LATSFVDEVVIHAKAGDGGDGAVAWRREKYVPRGGPAGGDGGNGGDVVLVADESVQSLLDFKYKPHLRAKNGENGRSKNQFGAAGEDAIARVPVGTQILDEDTGEVLADLTEVEQRAVVCAGGSGGHGNTRFATSTNQAPDFAKPGLPGDERRLRLSLKLLADVGLLGFPNAGKSTFLSTVSAAKPKIADYPFTTLQPKLGVVRVSDGESFVLADIPGLIEGAAEGAGLGIRFLKHLERVRVICHLIEAPSELYADDEEAVDESRVLHRYLALREELRSFDAELAERPEIVVISKRDLIDGDPLADPEVARLKRVLDEGDVPLFAMSAVTREGVEDVRWAVWEHVKEARNPGGSDEKKAYDPLS
jgi:GTP-binding protein